MADQHWRKLVLVLVLVAISLLPVQSADAGCWVCKDDRCSAATSSESGKGECIDTQICVVTCKDECDTGGASCEGSDDVPGGPETQGLIVPNGAPLKLLEPFPTAEIEPRV